MSELEEALDYLRDDGVWQINLIARDIPYSAETQKLLLNLPALKTPYPVVIGGDASALHDERDAISSHLPIAIALLAVARLAARVRRRARLHATDQTRLPFRASPRASPGVRLAQAGSGRRPRTTIGYTPANSSGSSCLTPSAFTTARCRFSSGLAGAAASVAIGVRSPIRRRPGSMKIATGGVPASGNTIGTSADRYSANACGLKCGGNRWRSADYAQR
jgi:hypothetical protein